MTSTVLMFEFKVPLPFTTEQTWAGFAGWVRMVTAKALPAGSGTEKVNGTLPLPVTENLSIPLSSRTSPVPIRPETDPLTVRPVVPQLTRTVVILPVAVPVPFETLQVWAGPLGWVFTTTE